VLVLRRDDIKDEASHLQFRLRLHRRHTHASRNVLRICPDCEQVANFWNSPPANTQAGAGTIAGPTRRPAITSMEPPATSTTDASCMRPILI
jgi:hypothetical protein